MNKISFDDFTEALQKVTSKLDDDDKLEFYEELLDTGSACVTTKTKEHNFSIHDGFEYELIDFKDQKDKAEEMLKAQASVLAFGLSLNDEDLKEIDDIVNSDVDDDPIDLSVLQKEADELEEDYTELTDEELIEIGIDPNTKKPIEIEFVINQLESLELNSTEMITEDGDCQIWKDDVIALKYAIVIMKTLKQLRHK